MTDRVYRGTRVVLFGIIHFLFYKNAGVHAYLNKLLVSLCPHLTVVKAALESIPMQFMAGNRSTWTLGDHKNPAEGNCRRGTET